MTVTDKDLQQHDKKRRRKNNIAGSSNHKRKSRRRDDPSAAGRPYELPMDLWKQILCFLDVPDLGSCAKVSKEISALTKHDDVWEHHLKQLLRLVFDGAIFLVPKQAILGIYRDSREEQKIWIGHQFLPKPLLERPLKSTNFSLWYGEWREISCPEFEEPRRFTKIDDEDHCVHWKAAVGGTDESYRNPYNLPHYYKHYHPHLYIGQTIEAWTKHGPHESYRWFVEDVPLRTYYRDAATFAYHNYRRFRREQKWARLDYSDAYDSEDKFIPCTSDDEDDRVEQQWGYRDGDIFRGLPNIRLFHGLGGLPTICACTETSNDRSKSRSLYRSYYLDSEGNVGYRYINAAGREVDDQEWYFRREEWD